MIPSGWFIVCYFETFTCQITYCTKQYPKNDLNMELGMRNSMLNLTFLDAWTNMPINPRELCYMPVFLQVPFVHVIKTKMGCFA